MENSSEEAVVMTTSSVDQNITELAVLYLPGVIVLTLISIFLALANISITLAIVVNKNLRTPSNFVYASLTTSAIFISVVTIPAVTWSFSEFAIEGNYARCLTIACLQLAGLISFVLNMLTSSFDMYFKLFYPFTYKKFMSIRKTVFLCAVTWILAIVFSVSPMFGWKDTDMTEETTVCRMKIVFPLAFLCITIYAILLPCTLVIVFLNSRVVYMAKKEARKIRNQNVAVNRTADFRTGRKSTIALLIMLAVLLIGWLPFLTLLQIAAFCPKCIDDKLAISLSLLALSSTSAGPLIYGLRQEEYRNTVKQICMIKPLFVRYRTPSTANRNLPENV